MSATKQLKWGWHVHHQILCELLMEPIENRIAYIRENKPAEEVELRLRLLKSVRGSLPLSLVKASAAWNKAYVAWDKANAAWNKNAAWDKGAAWDKAYAAWVKASAAWGKGAARGKANAAWVKASAAWDKANAASDKGAAWDKAYAAWVKASAAWGKANAACLPQIEALHKKECPDCPWDGKTIFPETK